MGRRINHDIRALTDAKINRLKEPGLFAVGGNLYVNVTPGGSRQWIFRYLRGRRRDMGLGSCEVVSLDEARTAALECRRLLAQGGDPIERRRLVRAQARVELARRALFADVAKAYYDAHSPAWVASYAKRWKANIEAYAVPVLGRLPASNIDTQLILQVIGPIWNYKNTLARKLRGWLEKILDFATNRGMREASPNPARWKGHLETQLAKPGKVAPVENHLALPWHEIPAFFAAVKADDSVIARAMELIILTGCRKSEALNAPWGEFDLAQRLWKIPAERMKAQRPHRVPLSAPAVELIKGLRAALGGHPLPQTHLFTWRGKPLNVGATGKLLKRIGYLGTTTTHGLRSTFADWADDCVTFPREMVELQLAHQVGTKTARAYHRADGVARRRALAEAWGNWCTGRPIDPSVLVEGQPPAAAVA